MIRRAVLGPDLGSPADACPTTCDEPILFFEHVVYLTRYHPELVLLIFAELPLELPAKVWRYRVQVDATISCRHHVQWEIKKLAESVALPSLSHSTP